MTRGTQHPPDAVRRLLDRRTSARAARDWAEADALRDELAAIGWEVQDGPAGSTVRPMLASSPQAGPADRLDEPARVPLAIVVVAEDHGDDLVRLLRGLAAHPPPGDSELLVVANAPTFDLEGTLGTITGLPVSPEVLPSPARLGWADARNLGLRASGGDVILLIDPSVEPTGDIVTPILDAFEDPSVGLVGGWGVRSRDGRQFDDAPPGVVDAVEGYCLGVRRDALRAVGGFDRRFRFYRNADLDFSFAVRDAGWRAVATEPLPAVRHEHRGWSAVSDDERERLSKRNFYRFLDRWRDRTDLLLDAE
jgi:GT2 family glycosyltransferase